MKVDDPELDPLVGRRLRGSTCRRSSTPPSRRSFSSRRTYKNERWLELALFADRRNNQPGQVTFEQLMTERNNLFRKHPKTRFVAAHFGWHANDLARAGKMLDEFPNVTIEAGAILYDLGRQPRTAREFFVKYQDRIMFGKDSFQPEEYPYYWRVFETADEVLRLLPRLPRVVEDVRAVAARRGVEEGVLQGGVEGVQGTAADGMAAIARGSKVPLFHGSRVLTLERWNYGTLEQVKFFSSSMLPLPL